MWHVWETREKCKPDGKRALERPRRRWRMESLDLQEIVWEGECGFNWLRI
jgi:hypothetical protein